MSEYITKVQIDLCQKIRAHCLSQHWFGSSAEKAFQRHLCDYYQYAGRCSCGYFSYLDRVNRDDEGKVYFMHDLSTGFEFPPATPEQVRRTEEALNFPLPPMLNALYTTIANGGFGPAYGLTGIAGGYTCGVNGRCQTLDQLGKEDPDIVYVDLAGYLQEKGNPHYLEWSPTQHLRFRHFWPICYISCGDDYYLDGGSGRIYSSITRMNDQGDNTSIIEYEAASLEEWLDRWLRHDR